MTQCEYNLRMPPLYYSISPDIFRKYPGYVRGVVLATGVHNGESPEALLRLLRQAEESVRARLSLETLATAGGQPAFTSWREAFRAFGAKPADFRPSVEAMARRVLRGDQLPSINALVDIGNVISLRYLLPAGSHAIDHLTGDISLGLADGTENFIALGSQELEHPLPGEVIFSEGSIVLTRRWVWRQGSHTLVLPESTTIEFNIDGLPPTSPETVEQAGQDAAGLISQFCGGQLHWEVLTVAHPRMQLI